MFKKALLPFFISLINTKGFTVGNTRHISLAVSTKGYRTHNSALILSAHSEDKDPDRDYHKDFAKFIHNFGIEKLGEISNDEIYNIKKDNPSEIFEPIILKSRNNILPEEITVSFPEQHMSFIFKFIKPNLEYLNKISKNIGIETIKINPDFTDIFSKFREIISNMNIRSVEETSFPSRKGTINLIKIIGEVDGTDLTLYLSLSKKYDAFVISGFSQRKKLPTEKQVK